MWNKKTLWGNQLSKQWEIDIISVAGNSSVLTNAVYSFPQINCPVSEQTHQGFSIKKASTILHEFGSSCCYFEFRQIKASWNLVNWTKYNMGAGNSGRSFGISRNSWIIWRALDAAAFCTGNFFGSKCTFLYSQAQFPQAIAVIQFDFILR
jgi:hypothetical protein